MANSTLITVLAILMITIGVGFIVLIIRGNAKPLPQGGVQWTAMALSALLVVSSVFLLALNLAYEPGAKPFGDGYDPTPDEMNQPAPNLSFTVLESGDAHSLEEYEGQVVLLNIWATWCAPCLEELPDLNALQAQYADEGLVVVTISDEAPEELLAFEEEVLPLETVSAYVPTFENTPEPFRRTSMIRPVSYVIDREGILRRFVKGAGSFAFFEEAIQPYLQDQLATR